MREVSREEIQLSIDNITENKNSLNLGELTAKADILDSVILILKECWNTTSGDEKQKRLKQIVDQDLDFSKVESSINSVKDSNIIYTAVPRQKITTYGGSLPNFPKN